MRVAILIGVSEYENLENLPSTLNDIEAMQNLLKATMLYPTVLTFSGRCIAADIREAIRSELEKFSEPEIDEVFFYFSGHGFAIDEKSYFATTDYDSDAPNKTSIQNLHVDDWLRALRPKVAIKVVDCCASGVRYIKNVRLESERHSPLRGEFNDLYFFHSSHWTQNSLVDGELSLFTRKFLGVIAASSDGPIKYAEITLALSDAFLNESQGPQMITSGTNTHVLCASHSDEVRAIARHYAGLGLEGESEEQQTVEGERRAESNDEAATWIERLRKEASTLIQKVDADSVLIGTKTFVEEFKLPREIDDLYKVQVSYSSDEMSLDSSDDDKLVQEETIGKWLKQAVNRRFFAEPLETEARRKPISIVYDPYGGNMYPAKVVGFRSTATVDFDWVRVRAISDLSNVDSFELALVLLWSRRKLAIFSYRCRLEERDWDRREQPESVDWRTWLVEKGRLEEVPNLIQILLSELSDQIVKSIAHAS